MTLATDLPAQIAHAARRVLIMQRHRAMLAARRHGRAMADQLAAHVEAGRTREPEYLVDDALDIDEDRATVRVRGGL